MPKKRSRKVHRCPCCNGRYNEVNGCVYQTVHFAGDRSGQRISYQPYDKKRPRHTNDYGRCPDCGCRPGFMHHPNCDQEDCPLCGHQLISCGCGYTGFSL